MRIRKRDWPQRVIRRAFEPTEIPQALWDRAHAQQAAWNDLVMLGAIAAGQAQADKVHAKLHWWCYAANAREIVQRRHGLNWVDGPELIDRVRTATQAAVARLRKGINPAGFPRLHYRLERIKLSHRFTGGGIPWPQLRDTTRGWRFHLSIERPGHGHQPCCFGLDETMSVEGRLIYGDGTARPHWPRPIPANAIVKQVAFCGVLRQPFGWEWSINVTVEEPPPAALRHERGVAGLDLGWRVMGDYLRLGVLVDESGATVELRLPFDRTTSRRNGGWRDLAGLDQQMDDNLELVKHALHPRLSNPPHGAAWDRLRERGLLRLLRVEDSSAEVREMLEWWNVRHHALWRRRSGLQARLLGNRRQLYVLLAQWLCRRYRTIGWESDLGLKDMAEQETGPGALRAAAQYRVMACVSDLRLLIRQWATRCGTTLVGMAAGSSRTCTVGTADGDEWCGALITPGASRLLTCTRGHTIDQDHNAARQLFSQTGAQWRRLDGLRASGEAELSNVLGIAAELRAVAVPASLE